MQRDHRRVARAAAVVLAALLGAAAPAAAQKATPTGSGLWFSPYPMLPLGARVTVLTGDPAAPVPTTMLLAMPTGYRVPPHFHPVDLHVLVKEGVLLVGLGDTFDAKHTLRMLPGDSSTVPANAHFFFATKGDTVLEVSYLAPFIITYLHDYDLPRRTRLPFGT